MCTQMEHVRNKTIREEKKKVFVVCVPRVVVKQMHPSIYPFFSFFIKYLFLLFSRNGKMPNTIFANFFFFVYSHLKKI
jgi:hypothetical protein